MINKEEKSLDTSNLYTSGTFAKMANVSLRTVRYYDKQNILKPTFVTEQGRRYYSEQDFARLQQILLFKYLGFSLEEIRELTIADQDEVFLANTLETQRKLIQDRIEQLQLVEQAIGEISVKMRKEKQINYSQMLELIHLTNMESSLRAQYQNTTNIAARIQLHKQFSTNQQGWFPWVYEQCQIREDMKIFEAGCGNGKLWLDNLALLPDSVQITLNDISEGMIRELKRMPEFQDPRFCFMASDCSVIDAEEESYDLVIANHTLFYLEDISKACEEFYRVLKPDGVLICGTYGADHMKEITRLVQEFDERIVLAGEQLYEIFGRENGDTLLSAHFSNVTWRSYEDSLEVNVAEPIIEYVLSCHGNQNQYILDRYGKFRSFVNQKVKRGFHITKDAGVFIATKK